MSIREDGALRIVNRHALYSAAAGLVPVPMFDLAAITGVQLKMLKSLADYYRIPFSEDAGKGMVSALIGGIVPTKLAYGAAGSMIKSIPVVGSVLGMLTTPAFGSAATYAVGKVFIQHFESGGTFLDFEPGKVRDHFAQEYQSARSTVETTVAQPTDATSVGVGA